ncbi:Set5p [Sugiyamaella lignohabitans]|uniref:Histone-lysine N-methyltransferase SET5 n=1 Tax=Sugiyamaella lignohabitans TaxID=796027 RepID=A0A167FS31_9ASCO|nr:Set5p [Sugiyamaella lignohabitans]ANB15631.1 Set5p [Sugiyamaella lignohabitans]
MSENTEYTPNDREVVSTVIEIWKTNPGSENLGNAKLHAFVKQDHPNWSLSANRLKNLLKTFGLQTNVTPFQYASEITSHATPDLQFPTGVKLIVTKARGKALYTSKAFKAGEEIWSEPPLVLVSPLDHVVLMRKCLACAYCSRPFQARSTAGGPGGVPRGGSECNVCPARFCNAKCKKSDTIHTALWHNSAHSKTIKYAQWQLYEQYCLENQWMAAYAYGIILVSIIRDPSKQLQSQIEAMARVRQDVRQKAVQNSTSMGLDGLDGEHYEQLWKRGFELLKEAVKGGYDLTYEEYLYGLGMYNINNLDGNVYLTQSHLNHSCDPNVDVQITGRTTGVKVIAKRDLRAGEELFTTYVNPSDDLDKRRYDLRVNWGFICNCARCKYEEKEKANPTPETRPRRKSVRFESVVDVI